MKKTLNLYERIPKSIENPRGVRVIEENENFIGQRPMLLCISAQDDTKSVFGITKFGMNAVGMRIRENNRTGFDLNGFPASFCAIRLEYVENDSEEHSEDNKESFFETFYDKYLKSVIQDNEGKKNIEQVAKTLRNLNILAYCNGNKRVTSIINTLKDNMHTLGYDDKEISYAVSQIGLVTLSTDINTEKLGCTVIDFHELQDTEVTKNQLHEATREKLSKEGTMEAYAKVDDRRVEFLINHSDEHSIKHYFYNGKATPACLRKVLSNLLESSIDASKGEFTPLTTEQAMQGCTELLQNAKNGKNREEILEDADKSISFPNAKKLTERESELQDSLDRTYDVIFNLRQDKNSLTVRYGMLEEENKKILEVINESCTQATRDKVILASGYQFSPQKQEEINNAPTDKEIIENQNKTIKEQKGQISNLQAMLKETLKFADRVRNSRFGKLFFRKDIRQLPPANKENDR